MKKEKLESIVLVLIGILAGGILVLVGIRYVLPAALPFLLAWGVAFAVRGPSKLLSEKLHISERIIRPVLAIMLTLLLFSIIGVILWQMIALVWDTLADIGAGKNPVYDILYALSSGEISIFGDALPEELAKRISDALGELLSSALSGIAAAVTSWVGAVPRVLLFLLVTLISLIFFAIDLEKINAFVRGALPEKLSCRLSTARRRLFSVAGKYVRSYLLIFGITLVIMTGGLMILGVRRALLLGFIIAVLDILPVIGVGTVLIPWSIIALCTGNNIMGIGLIILFLVNTVVRELAEPKILGKNLGIHPILSLILIYVGFALFGFTGLILTPIIAGLLGFIGENRGGSKDNIREKGDEKNAHRCDGTKGE